MNTTSKIQILRPSNKTTGNLKQKKNISCAPVDLATDESSGPNQLKFGAIIESEARSTGVQINSAAKLSTVTGLITKHADCHITFRLYPKRL